MKSLTVLVLTFFIFSGSSFCQEPGSKPDLGLAKGANAIITDYHVSYWVKSPTSIEKSVNFKVTVLNQSGKEMGVISTNIGKGEKISKFNGTVRKGDGTVSARIKLTDLKDLPAYPDFVFLGDNRVYYYEPVIESYPYSVEYEQTVNLGGMIAFDPWMPVSDEFVSCDTATLSITCPGMYKIRHREFNLTGKPGVETNAYGETVYTWNTGKIPAISILNFVPEAETFLPCVYVMPETFYYDGYTGNVTDWKDYGKWIWDLQEGRDEISEELKLRIKSMTAGSLDTRSRIDAVYRYLQENTRYVAITLGIGGLQSAKAEEVARYGYGDCKGLTNYMMTLLEAAGVQSFYTVIGNGTRKIRFDDFPYFQTNHVVLCVPEKNDTVWIECTSPSFKAGYLGYSNSNRKALLITPEGGILVNTPRADSTNSFTNSSHDLIVDNSGNCSFVMKSLCRGDDYEDLVHLRVKREDQKMKYMYDFLPFRNFTIEKLEILADSVVPASLTSVVSGRLNKYATLAGKRLAVPLIPYRLFDRVPKIEPDRTIDIS
ncbi:MAG TPA: DUF3857 domain-containing protein, partial [Bacteroidales bacterium]|nr:DUF3857 domain-containing protein [Bacteroidales bacterium]